MELRELSTGDVEHVRDLAQSAMTASYALSPDQIDQLVESEFGEDRLPPGDDSGRVVLVAEDDVTEDTRRVVGVVVGDAAGDTGEIEWLLVDPEHRGRGVGTELFESMSERLRDRGADDLCATVLEANTEGPQFFEQFEFERAEERQVELGGQTLGEYVYRESSKVGGDERGDEGADADEPAEPTHPSESPDSTETDEPDVANLPGVSKDDEGGLPTVTTEDDETAYLDVDDRISGRAGPFYPVYLDESFDDQYGYYCTNCGSMNVSMDDMERLACGECGNAHASRSQEAYDDSYL